jgi:hypothetical protein
MASTPKEVLAALLDNPTDLEHVSGLTTPGVTYVSLNFDNPDLHRIMPWCGTQHGPASIVKTFVDVARYWDKLAFETQALFGDDQHAALFGKMTYRSTVLGKTVTSPFAVYVHVTDGRCDYMQFMEDTFATGASFRQGGSWTFASNPDGEIVTI